MVACSADITKDELKVVTFDTSLDCHDCETKMFNVLPKEVGVVDLEVLLEEKILGFCLF